MASMRFPHFLAVLQTLEQSDRCISKRIKTEHKRRENLRRRAEAIKRGWLSPERGALRATSAGLEQLNRVLELFA